jgi:hypothetical protein
MREGPSHLPSNISRYSSAHCLRRLSKVYLRFCKYSCSPACKCCSSRSWTMLIAENDPMGSSAPRAFLQSIRDRAWSLLAANLELHVQRCPCGATGLVHQQLSSPSAACTEVTGTRMSNGRELQLEKTSTQSMHITPHFCRFVSHHFFAHNFVCVLLRFALLHELILPESKALHERGVEAI